MREMGKCSPMDMWKELTFQMPISMGLQIHCVFRIHGEFEERKVNPRSWSKHLMLRIYRVKKIPQKLIAGFLFIYWFTIFSFLLPITQSSIINGRAITHCIIEN